MRLPFAVLLVALVLPAACKRADAPPKQTEPVFYPDRARVLEAIESGRIDEAIGAMKSAPDTADVHYLKAKIALAQQDGAAYHEIKKAIAMSPDYAEYQFEFGMLAPLPFAGLPFSEAAGRFQEAGVALDRAIALQPKEARYKYGRAFFLTVAPSDQGGNVKEGTRLFDEIVADQPTSVWADRVQFDRAAEKADWPTAESHAVAAGEKDVSMGSRLWLLLAGSRLRAGALEDTRRSLEAAAKLNPPAAAAFCDAGLALDGGGNSNLALPFWARCLELSPNGPKSPTAKARLHPK